VHETTIWISLSSTAVVAAAGFVIATVVIARGWRLKP
jgi:hypothetical protein